MKAAIVSAAVFSGAYILGSVNFTVIIFRLLGKGDPRTKFSGNPGTTNVYRIAGPFWAALILILEMARAGVVSIVACGFLPFQYVTLAGFLLVLGNRYPCFHGFKGGKGVANYMGFVIFTFPVWGALATLLWPLIFKLAKATFIPSFIVITIMGIGMAYHFQFHPVSVAATAATLLLIFLGHKRNISDYLSHEKRP